MDPLAYHASLSSPEARGPDFSSPPWQQAGHTLRQEHGMAGIARAVVLWRSALGSAKARKRA